MEYSTPKIMAVEVSGPEENGDYDGSWPEWYVCLLDEDGTPIDDKNAIWICDSQAAALEQGHKIAMHKGIEFINDSMPE